MSQVSCKWLHGEFVLSMRKLLFSIFFFFLSRPGHPRFWVIIVKADTERKFQKMCLFCPFTINQYSKIRYDIANIFSKVNSSLVPRNFSGKLWKLQPRISKYSIYSCQLAPHRPVNGLCEIPHITLHLQKKEREKIVSSNSRM